MAPDESIYDVLVIGSGAAGLSLTLHLAGRTRIALLCKGELKETSTYYAQGGVAAVLDDKDSTESHLQDTLEAGAGLCREDVVRHVVENAKPAVQKLIDYGVDFSRRERSDGTLEFHLTREGGHSHRRVLHVSDATGEAIESTLEEQVKAAPDVSVFTHHTAIDVVMDRSGSKPRCVGAYALDNEAGRVRLFRARYVVLATGGSSKVYLYTSNPDGTTGDGVAMAWRAGCRVENMEFLQFHPTCLYHPLAKSFLITEAVRGEGGHLLLPDGSRFMDRFHPMAELAPRDVVARAIDFEMKRLGVDCLHLDISHQPEDFVIGHFPTIYRRCLQFGIDITKQPIPVVPAAHYTCGGVKVDMHGRTDVDGLYAIGEVSSTGLHGANRMASNSLLECLVFADAAARDIAVRLPDAPIPPDMPRWDESRVTDSDEEVVISHNWEELRRFMWDYVGIVRTTKRLERAKRRVDMLLTEIDEYYGNFRVTRDLLELRDLATVADLIIRSAMARKESRGLHYSLDHPEADTSTPPRDTILAR
ncbi:L-aspartate oxidase [Magnetospira sp. QH-2]|uniref:L-aspartate oxidase n=1 Tax=Magnetospira sp. (strain QH-2) TaxID=1288970 RepID=UPI0003E80F74|nr:L-aspartate oxidase [Magnetospira sp. QH-2]CCQ73404.1 L-aspartate oxidase [Magnetospira sp. QH-2]